MAFRTRDDFLAEIERLKNEGLENFPELDARDVPRSRKQIFFLVLKIADRMGLGNISEEVEQVTSTFRSWISEGLGVVNDWVDFEDLKKKAIAAGIKGGIAQLNKNLKAQYEWMPPIELDDETIDGLVEGVGGWLAEVVNLKLSEGMGREVAPFTSFYPPQNVVDELDVFLIDEINTKTGLNISSIVKNPDLGTELKDKIQEKFAQGFADKIAEQKARLVDDLANNDLYGTSRAMRMQVIDSVMNQCIDMILQKKVIGFNFDGRAFIQQQYKKQLNRKHQAAYRRLHREERRWVLRD